MYALASTSSNVEVAQQQLTPESGVGSVAYKRLHSTYATANTRYVCRVQASTLESRVFKDTSFRFFRNETARNGHVTVLYVWGGALGHPTRRQLSHSVWGAPALTYCERKVGVVKRVCFRSDTLP